MFVLKHWRRMSAAVFAPIFLFLTVDFIWPVSLDPRPGSRVVLAADGSVLRAFADSSGVWRYPIQLEQVSPLYLEALINYEDRYFYHHFGVNPLALLRAAFQAVASGQIISGGSTLTMQVARMRYPGKRNLWGKGKEIVRAIQLELHFSKHDILTYYLNHAPFGGTIEGVQAAALSYLGYSAADLTHAQAALLAVLPQAPSRYRPDRNPTAAQHARDKVINRLVEFNIWPADIALDARQENVIQSQLYRFQIAPILSRRLAGSETELVIQSTIDSQWQQQVEQQLKTYVQQIGNHVSAAAMVMHNQTGDVSVYAGSADFSNNNRHGHVDMVQAIRSPGSTLKPFIYGIAMDEGLIHSESLLMNVPLRFGDYQPENFSGGFTGPVSVAHSLAASLNVPAVQVLERVGSVPFYLQLQQAGAELQLPGSERPSLAIALGGLGTNLESLVSLTSALDNTGFARQPRFTINQPITQRALLSPGAAWIIRKILADSPSNPFGLAIKTGTSYGFRDSWALGVVNGYTIGVWVGQPDGTPLTGHYGRQTAVPLLVNIASRILDNNTMPVQPKSVSQQEICWPTGHPEAQALCDERHKAWLLNEQTPSSWMTLLADDAHLSQSKTVLRLATDTGKQVAFGCEITANETESALWPAPLQLWIQPERRNHTRLPDFDNRCGRQLTSQARLPLKISGVREGDAVIANEQQSPIIRLSAEGGQAPYYWYVDGERIRTNKTALQLTLQGEHQYEVVLMDYHGQIDRKLINTFYSNLPSTDVRQSH